MKTLYDSYFSTHFKRFYSDSQRGFKLSTEYFNANFRKFFPKHKDAQILEIGCGMGHLLYFLKKEGYINFIGIDISKEQIDYCQKKVTPKVKLIKSLPNFLKQYKNFFDLVVMNDVIEHLEKNDVVKALRLINNSLKINGGLLIKTANASNLWGTYVRYADFTHNMSFTQESLAQVLNLAGFNNLTFVREIHPIHDIRSGLRVFIKTLIYWFYKFWYLIDFGAFSCNPSNMLIVLAKKERDA